MDSKFPDNDCEPRVIYKDLARAGEAPACGPGGLLIRPGIDVSAEEPGDLVLPEAGGMSATPDDAMLMPQSRKPRSLGGTGRKPVWSIYTATLGRHALRCRQDQPNHALVEVESAMLLSEFDDAVCRTAPDWMLAYE